MKITYHIAYTKQRFGKQSAAIVTTVTAINVIQTLQVPRFKTVSVLDPISFPFLSFKIKENLKNRAYEHNRSAPWFLHL